MGAGASLTVMTSSSCRAGLSGTTRRVWTCARCSAYMTRLAAIWASAGVVLLKSVWCSNRSTRIIRIKSTTPAEAQIAEPGRGHALLVVEDLGIHDSGAVVDGGVQEPVADPGVTALA